MVVLKNSSFDNRCRFCAKVFCCSECRDTHESNKHAELNTSKPKCPLCFKYNLLYDPRLNSIENNFERAQLVCHVVINHLPLRCKICGDKFETNQDFQTAQPCNGPIKQLQVFKETAVTISPLINIPCTDNNNNNENADDITNSAEKKLPLTPQYHIILNATDKSLGSSGSLNLKHPENFDSPPELARHTSTPMHLSVVSLQKQHGHPPSVPEFNLKTPSGQRTFDNTDSTWGSAASAIESRYYTADVDGRMLRLSLESNSNSVSTRENQSTPAWSSPVYPILKKQVDRQHSGADSPITGANYRAERSILKSALLSRIDDSTRDSIEKRVRFSDQFIPSASIITAAMADTSTCDNDVFYEARESLDDDEHETKENRPIIKEVEQKRVGSVTDSSVGESKINASTTSISSTSSRVLMMLLVEKTDDAKGFSSLDLAPLIDTGLKKLEEGAASIVDSRTENSNHSSSGGTITKATTEITSYTRQVDGSLVETAKGCRRRASIKDTFMTMTDRIECITPPRHKRDTTTGDQERVLANKADSLTGIGSCKSDGLFSAMARVVRCALNKLPASVTARNLSREPIPPNPPPIAVATPVADMNNDSHADALVRRSSFKRPRERIDSHDEVAILRGSTGSNSSVSNSTKTRSNNSNSSNINHNNITNDNNNNNNNELVVTSPAAKRHRGWYRIRAREPIARMRERQVVLASPRGASRETQRFQQGALSIGDTFLPLPSRAHQSTQTEN